MSVDLLFSGAPQTGAVVNLVFGGGDDVPADSNASLEATLPSLKFAASVGAVKPVRVSAIMPALVVLAEARYDSNTARPVVGKAAAIWQVANRVDAGGDHSTWQETGSTQSSARERWSQADDAGTVFVSPLLKTFERVRDQVRDLFNSADRLSPGVLDGAWSEMLHGQRPIVVSFEQNADPLRASADSEFRNMLHDRRQARLSSWRDAIGLTTGRSSRWQIANPLPARWRVLYREAIRPPAGISQDGTIVPPGENCYTPPHGDAVHLVFSDAAGGGTDLVFICENHTGPVDPGETVVVPIRRVYMVLNNCTLRRVSDNALIPAPQMSLTIDADSWTWGFTASVPASAQPLVESSDGSPVLLEARINGTPYRVLAESLSRERTFGKSSIRIQGRGLAAVLDSPYSPSQTFGSAAERTAQQLMAEVLTINGVPNGWDVHFGLTDWLVSGGVFSHQGTYISALNAIANAAGGYLQPHATLQTLRVLARYPSGPWEWADVTPDYEIPSAVASRESITWTKRPDYNRVYVSGQQQGLLGQVTRAGTAGELLAPMVTDPLMTHVDAIRQRAIAVLSDTGQQQAVTLRMPVLESTGLILPGKFVRYVDGSETRLGIVRSTNVDVAGAEVWQSIGVETHA